MIYLKKILFIIIFIKIFFSAVAIAAEQDGEKEISQPEKNFINKKGYDWMGVPFVKFRSDFGVGGGAKVSLFDYGDGQHLPFKYNLQLQYFATSLGKRDHVLYFVAPNFLNAKLNFDVEIRYQHLDNSKYFGTGNNSEYNHDFESKDEDDYKSIRYYDHQRTKPRFVLNVLKKINTKLQVLMGLGLQRTKIKSFSSDGSKSLIEDKKPYGFNGGYTNFIKMGLVYDTRNFIAFPETGYFSEAAVELAMPVLASDYTYQRYTLTDRRYYRLFYKLVLAQRVIFEWMTGRPPFFEQSFIGGSQTLMEALGGDKSLRGYMQNRFVDKTKLITNSELRYLFASIKFRKESFDFYPILFWDMGRVYPYVKDFSFKYIKYSYGGGVRVAWNKFFVGRMDLGISEEGYGVNIGFANIF